jgi:hypothetical protein
MTHDSAFLVLQGGGDDRSVNSAVAALRGIGAGEFTDLVMRLVPGRVTYRYRRFVPRAFPSLRMVPGKQWTMHPGVTLFGDGRWVASQPGDGEGWQSRPTTSAEFTPTDDAVAGWIRHRGDILRHPHITFRPWWE